MTSILLGSFLSAVATSIGALPILFIKSFSHKWRDIILAFTAGVMVSASMFGLIAEAKNLSNMYVLTSGILLGMLVLTVMEKRIPHIDLHHKKINIEAKTILIIAAMCLHNIPEGLSVGISFSGDNQELGTLIALAIGFQNAPEGLLVALFLIGQKINKWQAFLIASLTGLIEIIASVFGYLLSSYVSGILPFGLSFAAGAMLFIVYKELIPESHGDGNELYSTYAFVIGLLSMIALIDIA